MIIIYYIIGLIMYYLNGLWIRVQKINAKNRKIFTLSRDALCFFNNQIINFYLEF